VKKTLPLLFMVTVVGLLSYGSYRKGYSTATSKAAAEQAAEYGNDWNEDATVRHSTSYLLGHRHGLIQGMTETGIKDSDRCAAELAEVAIESGNPTIGARLIFEGYLAPSQFQTALSQYNQKHPGNPR
jgi:hypothetical protein